MTIAQLQTLISTLINDNTSGEITAEDLRNVLNSIIDSAINKDDDFDLLGLMIFDENREYSQNQTTIFEGEIYQANQETTGIFDPSHWDRINTNSTSLDGKLDKTLSQFNILVGNGSGVATPQSLAGTGERFLTALSTGQLNTTTFTKVNPILDQIGATTKSLADLNAQYPTAKIGQEVFGTTVVYRKIGASSWISYAITTLT